MLVLSRKLEESIMIGDEIEIKVISVQGDTVKLGITAPKTIPVHRKEVYVEIEEENIRAAGASPAGMDKFNIMEHLFKDGKK